MDRTREAGALFVFCLDWGRVQVPQSPALASLMYSPFRSVAGVPQCFSPVLQKCHDVLFKLPSLSGFGLVAY
jgi:hypothetical protein